VLRCQRGGSPTAVNLKFSRPEPLLIFQVSPHLCSQGLSGPRSIPTATQKIWQRRESNPGPLCLQLGTLAETDIKLAKSVTRENAKSAVLILLPDQLKSPASRVPLDLCRLRMSHFPSIRRDALQDARVASTPCGSGTQHCISPHFTLVTRTEL
jgi:hypothetical protein